MIPEQGGRELHGVVNDREARVSLDERRMRRVDPRKIQLTRGERREFCRRFVHHNHHETFDARSSQRFGKPVGPTKDPALVGTILDELERTVADWPGVELRAANARATHALEVMLGQNGEIGKHVGEDGLWTLEPQLDRQRVESHHGGHPREISGSWIGYGGVARLFQGPNDIVGGCRHSVVPGDVVSQRKGQRRSTIVPAPRREPRYRLKRAVVCGKGHEQHVLLNLLG